MMFLKFLAYSALLITTATANVYAREYTGIVPLPAADIGKNRALAQHIFLNNQRSVRMIEDNRSGKLLRTEVFSITPATENDLTDRSIGCKRSICFSN